MSATNGNGTGPKHGRTWREIGIQLAIRLIPGLAKRIEAAEPGELKAEAKAKRISDGQALLRARMEACDSRIFDLGGVIDQHLRAGIPPPEDKARELITVQRERLDLWRQFEDGRGQLESASKAIDRQMRAIRGIAVAALVARCGELGAQVKEILRHDIEFLSFHPVSAPREARDLQRQAMEAEKIAALLGKPGEAYEQFEQALGAPAREVVDRWHGDLSRPFRAAVC